MTAPGLSRTALPSAVPLEERDRPRSGQGESRSASAESKSSRLRALFRRDSPPERASRALSPSSRGTAGIVLLRVVAVAGALLASGVAAACELPAGGDRLEAGRYALALKTEPGAIAVGKFFAVIVAVCARDGAPAPESVRVDASMPEHRHGMNYRPRISGDGESWRAEGLMFHMPGRWEFLVEIRAGGRTERATLSRRVD